MEFTISRQVLYTPTAEEAASDCAMCASDCVCGCRVGGLQSRTATIVGVTPTNDAVLRVLSATIGGSDLRRVARFSEDAAPGCWSWPPRPVAPAAPAAAPTPAPPPPAARSLDPADVMTGDRNSRG